MENMQPNEVCGYMTISEIRRYMNICKSDAYQLSHRKVVPVCRSHGKIMLITNIYDDRINARVQALIGL